MYARKYKRTVRRNRFRRRRQYRRRSTIYRRKRNIKRRSLKYRYQSEKFVSNATWSSSYANKPVVVTTSPSDWGGWGNMKNRYMEYKITCYKLEFLPRQSPAFPKIVEDGTAIDLPWMWMRYADRPLSTTTSLEAYTDVRKSAMRGYKKYIVKYPKYNWNDSAANLCRKSSLASYFNIPRLLRNCSTMCHRLINAIRYKANSLRKIQVSYHARPWRNYNCTKYAKYEATKEKH